VISSSSALVIGHRGASADHPENTLDAFLGAKAQGADWVELDVRLTADDHLVVLHDPHLPDGRAVATTMRADLPPEVPDLAAALATSAPMGVNVEVKHGPDEPGFSPDRRIADLVATALGEPPCEVLVSSFDLEVVERLRALRPDLATAYLVLGADEPVDAVAACVEGGHVALHPWDPMVDETLVERCRAAGVDLNVWTVDDPDRIVELAAWGVHGVVTNVPAVARAALAR
jgi:glycerophosphoryl diester phosphodiesterase